MAILRWSRYDQYTPAFDNQNPLTNRGSNSRVISPVIDNSTKRYRWMDIFCLVKFRNQPSEGSFIALYLIPSINGVDYADGDSSTVPQTNLLIATFRVSGVDTLQRLAATNILVPPCKFKLLWENKSNQQTDSSQDENQIYYRFYTEEIV